MVRLSGRSIPIAAIIPASAWKLPGDVDGWLIEDEKNMAALPSDARGFVVARLNGPDAPACCSNYVRLDDRNRMSFLRLLPALLLMGILLVPVMRLSSLGDYPSLKTGLRRWVFLAAKILLILFAGCFALLDVLSCGLVPPPVVMDLAFFGWVFGLRWTLADQRRRCPVCLRLLANPVRIGQSSRMFLEWHGTELICPRGHGLLHVPELPSIWFTRQRWMDLGTSWSGLFP